MVERRVTIFGWSPLVKDVAVLGETMPDIHGSIESK